MHSTWIRASGFDDVAVWRTIWQDQDHVVCRLYHTDRLVEFQDRAGQWHEGDIAQACSQLRPIARAETSLEVQVQVLGTNWEPWLLLTDWPVEDEQQAVRIFAMDRQRWAVEDSFKVTKACLGWEEVQVLDLRGLRRLLAMLATQAILSDAAAQPGGLPPNILAFLQGWQPPPPEL